MIVIVATAPARGAEFVIARSILPDASVFVVVTVADTGDTEADA